MATVSIFRFPSSRLKLLHKPPAKAGAVFGLSFPPLLEGRAVLASGRDELYPAHNCWCPADEMEVWPSGFTSQVQCCAVQDRGDATS